MTFTEATEFLFGLRRFGWRPGLETIQHLLGLLGNPQERVPSVHVAGTNGKGSTAAMLSAILRASGCRTALYTSPHLLSFTERIRIDGLPIREAEVAELADQLRALCEGRFVRSGGPDALPDRPPYPTFFEMTTAMAFLHFARRGAEVSVIEVGLGGRLDATNVLTPRVSVVTNISLEHQEYLGRSVAEIAAEKAGIIKAGVPVVSGARGEALEVIKRIAAMRQAPLVSVPRQYGWQIRESGLEGQRFDLEGPTRRYASLWIPLAGRHQVENAALAVATCEVLARQGLRVGEADIREGLAATSWPGRLHWLPGRPRILLDGAHNPAGAEALAAFLTEHRAALHRLILIFGVLKDKDWQAMLEHLGPLAERTILTRPPSERAADPHDLRKARRHSAEVEVAPDPGEGLALARRAARPEDTILVTGSLYTVAAALRHLGISVT